MFLTRIKTKLSEIYEYEYSEGRIALLIPILFGIGIAAYFSLHFEPEFKRTCIGLAVAILVLVLSTFFKRKILLPAMALVIFASGFFAANLEAIIKKSPVIKENLGVIWLRANVKKAEFDGKFYRLYLTNNDLWQPEKGKFLQTEIPERIRLTVRTKILTKLNSGKLDKNNFKDPANWKLAEKNSLNENDYIQVRVILAPPAKYPAYPNGYDFGKYAYFDRVGAVGFSISDVKILKDNNPSFLENIRTKINEKIDETIENKTNASVLKALITGQVSEIDKTTNQNLRYSGLGHILSISGLHLSIVMLWVYAFIRTFLAFFPVIALNFDTKKIASVIAIIFGFFYLMLADAPVPAVRSYVMLLLFFLGVLIDREITPMRPVAVAALIILMVQPHALISVSFQLSFAAIVSIAGFYEIGNQYFKNRFLESQFLPLKIIKYVLGILLTSLIVGFVTAPITAYNFNNISKYGLISNMLTVPLVSFVTMPTLAVSALLMPFDLHGIFVELAETGVKTMLWSGAVFGGTDNTIWRIPQLPTYLLPLAIIGWTLLFTFKGKVRFISIPLILAAYFTLIFIHEKPDVVVDANGKFFAIKNNDTYNYYGRLGGFKQKQFTEKLGIFKGKRIYGKKDDFCTEKNCFNKNIAIIQNPALIKIDNICSSYKIIFNLSSEKFSCSNSKVISLDDLKHNGTYIAWQNGKIDNVKNSSGTRIWNNKILSTLANLPEKPIKTVRY